MHNYPTIRTLSGSLDINHLFYVYVQGPPGIQGQSGAPGKVGNPVGYMATS